MRRVRKFLSLPLRQKWLFLEALVELLKSGFLLNILSFRRIMQRYPPPVPPAHTPANGLPEEIKTAIRHAGHLLPWENRCLVRALAARSMLSRRGIPSKLSLGVLLDDRKKMSAHAWLTTEDLEVVEKNGTWKELSSF